MVPTRREYLIFVYKDTEMHTHTHKKCIWCCENWTVRQTFATESSSLSFKDRLPKLCFHKLSTWPTYGNVVTGGMRDDWNLIPALTRMQSASFNCSWYLSPSTNVHRYLLLRTFFLRNPSGSLSVCHYALFCAPNMAATSTGHYAVDRTLTSKNMAATLRAFRAEYYLRHSNGLKLLGWFSLAARNSLLVQLSNQSIYQPSNQPNSQSINQSIKQSAKIANWSTNQSINSYKKEWGSQ